LTDYRSEIEKGEIALSRSYRIQQPGDGGSDILLPSRLRVELEAEVPGRDSYGIGVDDGNRLPESEATDRLRHVVSDAWQRHQGFPINWHFATVIRHEAQGQLFEGRNAPSEAERTQQFTDLLVVSSGQVLWPWVPQTESLVNRRHLLRPCPSEHHLCHQPSVRAA
jgi:hypothetical protein